MQHTACARFMVIESGLVGGSSGFPANGLPFPTINIGDGLSSFSVDTIEHVITHELGHTIGFRHSDFFNRSISCGIGGNEGDAGVGAIHVPGTPTDATVGRSIMNSCFRTIETGEFTASDVIALRALYAQPTQTGGQDYVVIWNSGGRRQLATYVANDNGLFQDYVNTSSVGGFIPDTTGRDLGVFVDVTGDGRQDYVVIWNSGGQRQLATYMANGNGTFQEYVNTSSVGGFIPDTTSRDLGFFADVTGDGRQDYVVIWNSGGRRQLATYVANSNGSFQEYANTSSAGSFIPDTTGRDLGFFADATGDGRKDYVVIWNSGGQRQLATYVANSNGTFQEYVNTPSGGSFIPDTTGRDLGSCADVTGGR